MKDILPHNYPFRFLDDNCYVEGNNLYCVLRKNFSFNEWYFHNNLLPRIILVELMAQGCGYLSGKKKKAFVAKIDKVDFFSNVVAGDIVIIKIKVEKSFAGLVKIGATIVVETENELSKIVASGKLVLSFFEGKD